MGPYHMLHLTCYLLEIVYPWSLNRSNKTLKTFCCVLIKLDNLFEHVLFQSSKLKLFSNKDCSNNLILTSQNFQKIFEKITAEKFTLLILRFLESESYKTFMC